MSDYNIRKADSRDAMRLREIFVSHIAAHPEYISHGEIQMGVGVASHNADGSFVGRVAPDADEMWLKYAEGKIVSDQSCVFLAETSGGDIMGFSIVDIEEDGADPFGMLCDLLVLPQYRSRGIGAALMKFDFEWFSSKGVKDVYLESGKDNHDAHAFFERRGFEHVSNIYKVKN